MTKFYVDVQGNYLGGFDGAPAPVGAIEIEKPPKHGRDKYNNVSKDWIPYIPPPEPPSLESRITALETRIAALEKK